MIVCYAERAHSPAPDWRKLLLGADILRALNFDLVTDPGRQSPGYSPYRLDIAASIALEFLFSPQVSQFLSFLYWREAVIPAVSII